jgi:hypothetical protein
MVGQSRRWAALGCIVLMIAIACTREEPEERQAAAGGEAPVERPENAVVIGNRGSEGVNAEEGSASDASTPDTGGEGSRGILFGETVPARDRDLGELYGGNTGWADAFRDVELMFEVLGQGGDPSPYLHPDSETVLRQQLAGFPRGSYDLRMTNPVVNGDLASARLKVRGNGFSNGEVLFERVASGAWRISGIDIDPSLVNVEQNRDRFEPASYGDVLPYL